MNKSLTLTMSCNACLSGVEPQLLARFKKELTMANPKYLDAVKYGRWVGKNMAKTLSFYEVDGDTVCFPRGFANQALTICRQSGFAVEIKDKRRLLPAENFVFSGALRPYQQKAVADIVRRQFGVLEAGTGSGKTVMALAVLAERRQPALVLVHTRELLYQWAERIGEFLDIGKPGLVGDGCFELKPVTIAIINSAKNHLSELIGHFGQIIVDECHRCPSSMFTAVVREFDCYYSLGLSATPYRRDKLTKLIYWYLGDPVHRVETKEIEESGAVLRPEIVQRTTEFYYKYRDDYSAMLAALCRDEERNRLIVGDIAAEAQKTSGTVLVVSDRVAHCEKLAEMLAAKGLKPEVLTGRTPAPERSRIISQVRDGELDILIATLQLIGEGFDCQGLHTVFLTTPIKFSARLLQVIGRILRPASGKNPRVIDYVDYEVPLLRRAARAREQVYLPIRRGSNESGKNN